MKINQASDLVPVQVLIWAANKIANSARGFARSKGIGRVVGIKVGNTSVTKQTISASISTTKAGMAFEHGSGLHDPRGARLIEINAINKPFLVFEGTNKYEGQLVKVKQVHHPGVAPRPFLEPAKLRHREEIKERIKEKVGVKLRFVVRGMARKI